MKSPWPEALSGCGKTRRNPERGARFLISAIAERRNPCVKRLANPVNGGVLRLPFLPGGTQPAVWLHAPTAGRPCLSSAEYALA